jgi:hypothetical protein
VGANDPRVGATERNPAPISGWQRHTFAAEDKTRQSPLALLPDVAALTASRAANVLWVVRDDESGRTRGEQGRGYAVFPAPPNAELRRLIRAGFEQGIPGEQLAQAAGCQCRACIRSGTGGGRSPLSQYKRL